MADFQIVQTIDNYLYFVAIVEQGSITKAATYLNVPKSKVSRRLAQLENMLGSELLVRTTRKQDLTEAGKLLYQNCRPHVDALVAVEQLMYDNQYQIKGKLNIKVPSEFFNRVMGQLLTDFALKYPDIEVHCQQYTESLPSFDLNYDLVFVLHERALPPSHWIGKSLLSFPQSLYVAKDYALNQVTSVEQLKAIEAIVAEPLEHWSFRDKHSHKTFKPNVRMVLASPEMRLQACFSAIGMTKLPDYIAKNIQGIKAVKTELPLVAQQLSLLYQSRNIPLKTRVFLDYFQSHIGKLNLH
ncbi:LysR family transcriptional regulator [Thalassotalea marina]|uniref:LysR family transcriptional regulator n=1 Tax=Thalassotalea marina TaxID=1673741 RepID=A0A919BD14_9GAMM|nr:LysR family transcriptional regulator [Thalassotalea marina]GHF83234.1 LysR family transcriptional regulator [Thalassotalea marina]